MGEGSRRRMTHWGHAAVRRGVSHGRGGVLVMGAADMSRRRMVCWGHAAVWRGVSHGRGGVLVMGTEEGSHNVAWCAGGMQQSGSSGRVGGEVFGVL